MKDIPGTDRAELAEGEPEKTGNIVRRYGCAVSVWDSTSQLPIIWTGMFTATNRCAASKVAEKLAQNHRAIVAEIVGVPESELSPKIQTMGAFEREVFAGYFVGQFAWFELPVGCTTLGL